MERKPASVSVRAGLNRRRRTHSRQDLPGYEQKPDTRPTTPGERAADRETEPEDGAQVDRELGQGQITCFLSDQERPLFGEGFILCPPVELAPKRGEPWQHAFTIEVVSRGHSSDPPNSNGDTKA